jgi:hypothetical protein
MKVKTEKIKTMLNYKIGNLFDSIPKDKVVFIPHIVNDIKAWGSGFVVPLGRKYPQAMNSYLSQETLILGNTDIVNIDNKVIVHNMIAQKGTINHYNSKPIKYLSLISCLKSLKQDISEFVLINNINYSDVEIHAPAFGSNRAGGNWIVIKELVEEIFEGFDVNWYVYTLSQKEQESLGV